MMITIQPFSQNNISFSSRNKKQPRVNKNVLHPYENIKQEKNISFVKGALYTAAILCGLYQCESHKKDTLLDFLQTELEYSDPKTTKIKVEDATGDNVADFIIEDKHGYQSVYDMKNGSLYYKDGEEIEKFY